MSPDLVDILQQAGRIKTEAEKTGSTIWFRGLSRSDYPLLTTLQRKIDDLTKGCTIANEEKYDLLRDEVRKIFWKFQSYGWSLLDPKERTKFGMLFRMRHQGIPCNIMDWTESFACALYFAQRGRAMDQESAVYTIDPQALNMIALGRPAIACLDDDMLGNFPSHLWHPISLEKRELPTVAALPYHSNPRTVAQRAMFTMNGSSLLPLEDQFDGKLISERIIQKIVLPVSAYEAVDQYLKLTGLDAFTYYPDFEGLRMKIEDDLLDEQNNARKLFPDQFASE